MKSVSEGIVYVLFRSVKESSNVRPRSMQAGQRPQISPPPTARIAAFFPRVRARRSVEVMCGVNPRVGEGFTAGSSTMSSVSTSGDAAEGLVGLVTGGYGGRSRLGSPQMMGCGAA